MDLQKKLSSLHELSKLILSNIFNLNSSSKYLVLEPAIIKPLEKICGVKWLKSNGVDKIFKLEPTAPPVDSKSVFYIIYSNFATFTQVVDQIRSFVDINNLPYNKFHIIVVPQVFHLFELELEEYGLFDCCKLHSFQWFPVRLDAGLLSLESPLSFKSIFVDQSLLYLPMFSKCLWQLSLVIGKPNFIFSLGQHSNAIQSQFETLCDKRGTGDKVNSDVGGVIILDRNTDYSSTFLTPGIYSALLKEIYDIKSGFCECKLGENEPDFDDKFNPITKKDPVTISLDSELDAVYACTKNKYFSEVTNILSTLTKELKTENANSKNMSLDEMKKYVQNQLPATSNKKKIISNHLVAAQTIINILGWRFENLCEIESNIINNVSKSVNFNCLLELISVENNPSVSLRLFCLLLLTQKLTDGEITMFWEKFFHQFGYKYLHVIQNLTNAGIISDKIPDNKNKFVNINLPIFNLKQFYTSANRLKQIPSDKDKIDFKNPTCPSYVFRGTYIPLIAQIVTMISNSIPLDEIRSKLEGAGSLIIKNEKAYPLVIKSLLIYLIGGVTYAEIGALNLIEELLGIKMIILSDRIVGGNDIVGSFLESKL